MDILSKKNAKNKRIQYGDPIVLHSGPESVIKLIPFYIPHTNYTDFCAKISKYAYDENGNLKEEKSISLNSGKETMLLQDSLKKCSSVAKTSESGDFIVIKLQDGSFDLKGGSPEILTKALLTALSQSRLLSCIDSANLTDELTLALRHTIKIKDMQKALEQLKTHLADDSLSEQKYKEWCKDYSWIFGNAYVIPETKPLDISPKDKLDLTLSNIISGFRDIVELKLPTKEVLLEDKSHHNWYFSSEVSKAIGQCHRYLDHFQLLASKGLLDDPYIIAYHPRATIVIGRSVDWTPDKTRALHGLNSRLSNISIITYDQLLTQGRNLISLLSSKTV